MIVAKRFAQYRLDIIAALVGATIMILELVGARQIAPYFGTSIYVWTAVIGVILGAIALGEVLGGRWADRDPSYRKLSVIIITSAGILLFTQLIHETILSTLSQSSLDLRIEALFAALLLFAPVNFFFGIVSPYLVKLKLKNLDSVGASVGTLYAAGTIGSIIGTFSTGYFLLSFVGSRELGLSMVVVLAIIAFIAYPKLPGKKVMGLSVLLIIFSFLSLHPAQDVRYDSDSAYSRYQVIDVNDGNSTIRQLRTDNLGVQSAIELNDPDILVARYNEYFNRYAAATKPKNVLIIGGGTYTFPRVLASQNPDMTIDVVEIDPKLEQIARDYFSYTPQSNLNIINQDGRTFLNNNKTKYDVIFMDAYTSLSPPFQLTTSEAVKRVSAALTDDGSIMINLISALEGNDASFLQSTLATYEQYFAKTLVYQTYDRPKTSRQNLVIVASKQADVPSIGFKPFAVDRNADALILTDNYAPVERMTQE